MHLLELVVFARYTPRRGMAASCGSSVCSFLGKLHPFPTAAAPITTPPAAREGSPRPRQRLFAASCSDRCEALSPVRAVLTGVSLTVRDAEHLLLWLYTFETTPSILETHPEIFPEERSWICFKQRGRRKVGGKRFIRLFCLLMYVFEIFHGKM